MMKFLLIIGFIALINHDLVAAQTRISNTDKTLNVAKGDTNIKLHCKVISDEYPLNLFNKVLVWSKIQDKSSTLDTEDFETTAINTGSSAIINDPFKTSLSINISSDTATKATDFTLTMKTVAESSSGKYACVLRTQSSVIASVTYTVHVAGDAPAMMVTDKAPADISYTPPAQPPFATKLNMDSTRLNYIQGTPGFILCQGKGSNKMDLALSIGDDKHEASRYMLKQTRQEMSGSVAGLRKFEYTAYMYHVQFEPPTVLNLQKVSCASNTAAAEKQLQVFFRPNITCEEGTVVTLENNKVRCEVRAYPLPGDIYWYVKDPESKKVEELRQSTENKGGSVTKTMSISGEADKDRLDSILTFHMLRKGLDVTQMVTVNASNPLGLTEVKFGIVGNVNGAATLTFSLLTIASVLASFLLNM